MGKSLTQKILEKHIVEGEFKAGKEIGIKIDQTLTQDATGTMAYLQFEALCIPKVRTELSVSYIDHNTIQIGFENADDHQYLQTIAAKYGILLSKAGNGICHQVHLERFGKPGKTLLGSDSHTPTGGGLGMIAIGAGGLDVAVAMGGGLFYLTYPKIIKINLIGKLKPWVTAKDIILKILDIFSTKGNVGYVFEFGGAVNSLSVPERATIANMGTECGVTTSIFPSDEITKAFLRAQNREKDWIELKADEDAEYDRIVDINLDEIVPLAACPHSPDNIKTVKELEGIEVNQVCIGSCTNSSYKDLMTLAKILRNKKIHPNVSLIISPGSKQVLENIAKNGALTDILYSGARITDPVCGFCIGNSQSPQTNAISIRTSNRNFFGRSGTKSAQVYLTSVETAVACAITGKITDPRNFEMDYPQIKLSSKFHIDDNMILQPSANDKEVQIYRGPNIGQPPLGSPLSEHILGNVAIKVGDKITTDHIIPAGSKMKYRSNISKYAEFVFELVDNTFYKRAMDNKNKKIANIIVGGLSYGQGSSREHAALCPMFLGVKAVIAKSFERIHTANLINFGIIPLIFKSEADYSNVEVGDQIEISHIKEKLLTNKELTVKNITKNMEFGVNCNLSNRQRNIILAGGLLSYTKSLNR
ncbi:MAG: aconitate hydratase [bacterium]|nr:aconitate hydratase [bacterium]